MFRLRILSRLVESLLTICSQAISRCVTGTRFDPEVDFALNNLAGSVKLVTRFFPNQAGSTGEPGFPSLGYPVNHDAIRRNRIPFPQYNQLSQGQLEKPRLNCRPASVQPNLSRSPPIMGEQLAFTLATKAL